MQLNRTIHLTDFRHPRFRRLVCLPWASPRGFVRAGFDSAVTPSEDRRFRE